VRSDILVLIIGGGAAYATNTPTARAERQLNLGNKYLQEGKYQEAILAFEKVIAIESKNIPARLGLGNAYIATKELTKAEVVLKEVIEIDQNNIPAREALFNVYIKEGNLDNATTILKGISEIDPNKDVKQFNADLESAKAISASKASYDQGIKQMGDKQYLDAVDSFQKVVKEDTERYTDAQTKTNDCKKSFVDATLQKAKDAASNKDYATALNLLELVLKVDPNNQDALKLKSEYTNTLEQIRQEQEKKSAMSKLKDFKVELVNRHKIWIEYTDGKRELLLDGTDRDLWIDNAQASIDGTGVYYTTDAGVISSCSVHFINIKTKEIKDLGGGYLKSVISDGEYAGKLIVSEHFYYGPPNYGSYDEVYIVDNNTGRNIKKY